MDSFIVTVDNCIVQSVIHVAFEDNTLQRKDQELEGSTSEHCRMINIHKAVIVLCRWLARCTRGDFGNGFFLLATTRTFLKKYPFLYSKSWKPVDSACQLSFHRV